jgi:hypothetical protein
VTGRAQVGRPQVTPPAGIRPPQPLLAPARRPRAPSSNRTALALPPPGDQPGQPGTDEPAQQSRRLRGFVRRRWQGRRLRSSHWRRRRWRRNEGLQKGPPRRRGWRQGWRDVADGRRRRRAGRRRRCIRRTRGQEGPEIAEEQRQLFDPTFPEKGGPQRFPVPVAPAVWAAGGRWRGLAAGGNLEAGRPFPVRPPAHRAGLTPRAEAIHERLGVQPSGDREGKADGEPRRQARWKNRACDSPSHFAPPA